MKFIILLLALPLINEQCNNKNKKPIPACILEKIEEIKKETKWNPPAEINEYEFEGKTAYLITSNCCDQYNSLVDSNCNVICAPSGGLTGKGDGKCNDFAHKAKHVKLIWKDER
jgi:hypothetical protein